MRMSGVRLCICTVHNVLKEMYSFSKSKLVSGNLPSLGSGKRESEIFVTCTAL